jgi:uncharacterized protein YndB with AHSA1/START domain
MAPRLPWEEASVQNRAVDAVVHVTREYPVPREKVFSAWTESELLSQWFRPENGFSSAELDVRPGGRYRITMQAGGGLPGPVHIVGTYLEVLPPERLVCTFGWEAPPVNELDHLGDLEDVQDLETRLEKLTGIDSRLTVQFRDLGGSTEVSVTHERLATQRLRAFHVYGWERVLDRLGDLV